MLYTTDVSDMDNIDTKLVYCIQGHNSNDKTYEGINVIFDTILEKRHMHTILIFIHIPHNIKEKM